MHSVCWGASAMPDPAALLLAHSVRCAGGCGGYHPQVLGMSVQQLHSATDAAYGDVLYLNKLGEEAAGGCNDAHVWSSLGTSAPDSSCAPFPNSSVPCQQPSRPPSSPLPPSLCLQGCDAHNKMDIQSQKVCPHAACTENRQHCRLAAALSGAWPPVELASPPARPTTCIFHRHRQVAKFVPLAGSPQPAFSTALLASGELLNGRGYFKDLPPDWVSEMVSRKGRPARRENEGRGNERVLARDPCQ